MDLGDGNIRISYVLIYIALIFAYGFFNILENIFSRLDKRKYQEIYDETNDQNVKDIIVLLDRKNEILVTFRILAIFFIFIFSVISFINIYMLLGKNFIDISNFGIFAITLIISAIINSLVMVLFGEIVPGRLSAKKSEKNINLICRHIKNISFILLPFTKFLMYLTKIITKTFKLPSENFYDTITEEKIISLVDEGEKMGLIDSSEREMIDGVMDFNDIIAEEIITARTEVFMIDIEEPLKDNIDEMIEFNYSRVPIYRDDIDNIIGILHMKDFLKEAYKVGFENVNIEKIMRPPYLVPNKKNINQILKELKRESLQMAILIDEFGGFSGVVTMEDMLRVIVGNIGDEYDEEEREIQKISDNEYIAMGSITIKMLNNILNKNFDETTDDYDTLAGLIISLLEFLPEDGTKVKAESELADFEVLEVEDKRIKKVKIILKDQKKENE